MKMEVSNLSASVLNDLSESCTISPNDIEDVYPCTPIQLGLMADSLNDQRSYIYRDVFAVAQGIDLDRLCWAIDRVVSNNAILRTRIVDNSELGLVQVVIIDGALHRTHQRSIISVSEFLHEDSHQPMGLGLPLWRSTITGRQWVVTMHHAIIDAASAKAVALDVALIYRGFAPKTHTPFKVFVEHCCKIDTGEAEKFWSSRFNGTPAIFPRNRDSSVEDCQTAKTYVDLSDRGNNFSVALLPSYLEAAWALTVYTYTGDTEIAFGVAYSGRSSALKEVQSTLGPTLTTIPLQVSVQPNIEIRHLLKERAQQRRRLQTHPAMQYGLKQIGTSSDAARIASKFETVINLLFNQRDESVNAEIFKFEFTHNMSSPYGLMLTLRLDDRGIDIEALYKPSSLRADEVHHIFRQFEHVLSWLLNTQAGTVIRDLPILNQYDRKDIVQWNHGSLPAMIESTLTATITTQTRDQPDAIAVEAGNHFFSYQELDNLSSLVAEALAQKGVGEGVAVPFMFEKSAWAVIAILAILKAGGACVPLDPDHPVERKRYILEVTGATLVLASSTQQSDALRVCPNVFVVDEVFVSQFKRCKTATWVAPKPDHCAYILFTSGSTGQPKGVVQEHRSLVTSLAKLRASMGIQAGLRVLQFASFIWDISLLEIFGALVSGATLCIPSETERKGDLPAFINSRKIDWMALTPTVLRTMRPDEISGVRTIASIGEPIDSDAFSSWGKGRHFLNVWGPTEGAMANTVARLHPNSLYTESIGSAVNCAIWIVKPETLHLVPVGAIGEILIEGPTVARGYLHSVQPSPFIAPKEWASPTKGQHGLSYRLYRTGDLAKQNSDGSLCYVGRSDSQVKLHGQRFELGEVESLLGRSGYAKDICVTVQSYTGLNGAPGSARGVYIDKKQLIAVVSLAKTGLPSNVVMQEFSGSHLEVAQKELGCIGMYLKKRLPLFMVPSLWIGVERLPRTATDKLNRKAIEEWLERRHTSLEDRVSRLETHGTTDPPVGDNEILLRDLWSSLLGIAKEQIGRQHSFIDLGGDSVLAMQMIRRCRSKGLEVTISQLLRGSTLCAIADSCQHSSGSVTSHHGPQELCKSNVDSHYHRPSTQDLSSVISEACTTVSSHLRKLPTECSDIEAGRGDMCPKPEDIEAAAPAYDAQALMISFGEAGARAFYNRFQIIPFGKGLDLTKVQAACEEVVKQHAILRTIFIQAGKILYQAVRRHVRGTQVLIAQDDTHPSLSIRTFLACFQLVPHGDDPGKCTELRLWIHHALYDAWSLGIVLRELGVAYAAHQLTSSPSFMEWTLCNISISDNNKSRSTDYWQQLLHASKMTYLAPTLPMSQYGSMTSDSIRVRVPSSSLHTSYGTPSSAFKAAWALLLSHASAVNDVVFSEINANRDTSFPGSEMICGPCATPMPVRALLSDNTKFGDVIQQLQEQFIASSSHQHIAIRSITRTCTQWPFGFPSGSLIAFQNHRSLPSKFELADGNPCSLSAIGTPGELAQIWIVAVPTDESLTIDITYFPYRMSQQQALWIAECLTFILNNLQTSLRDSLSTFKRTLSEQPFGPFTSSPHIIEVREPCNNESPTPSQKAKDLVIKAWAVVGLHTSSYNDEESMFKHDGDIVTAFLLSEHFKHKGYPINTREVVENPSRQMLASLLDHRILSRHVSVAPT